MITNTKYQNLTSNEKLLYALLLNRINLSRKNHKSFSDNNGIFIYYSNKQIQRHLNCSDRTAAHALNNLEQAGLIRKEYQQIGLPLKIYVNDIREMNKDVRSFASEKPQDKFSQKPYSNSNYNAKPYKSTPVTQEKQVSFDVEKAEEMKLKHLYNFAEKTKKRRTRSSGPTL